MGASRGSARFANGLFPGLGSFLGHGSGSFFRRPSFLFGRRLRMKLLGARLVTLFRGASQGFPRKQVDG